MLSFAKTETCPASETLDAYRADMLSHAARRAVASHLRACDFCAAELRLLTRGVSTEDSDGATPPVPLALRLFAEARLAEVAALAAHKSLRAA